MEHGIGLRSIVVDAGENCGAISGHSLLGHRCCITVQMVELRR